MPPDAALVEQRIAGPTLRHGDGGTAVCNHPVLPRRRLPDGQPGQLGARSPAGLSEAAQATVVLPDYRLAPEHPFPAALQDAVAVYRALAQKGEVFVRRGLCRRRPGCRA